jgi:hypothetical protein
MLAISCVELEAIVVFELGLGIALLPLDLTGFFAGGVGRGSMAGDFLKKTLGDGMLIVSIRFVETLVTLTRTQTQSDLRTENWRV